jgi:hypothetical protein
MANKLGWCAFSVIQLLGTVGVMSQVAWPVFAIFIPVTAICYIFQVRALHNDSFALELTYPGKMYAPN